MNNKAIVCIAAIAGITAIEIAALNSGINGALLTSSFVAIGGIGGYILKKPGNSKEDK